MAKDNPLDTLKEQPMFIKLIIVAVLIIIGVAITVELAGMVNTASVSCGDSSMCGLLKLIPGFFVLLILFSVYYVLKDEFEFGK